MGPRTPSIRPFSVAVGRFAGVAVGIGVSRLAAGALLAPGATRGALSFLVGGVLAFPFDLAAGQGIPSTPVGDTLRAVAAAIAGVPAPAFRWGGYALPPLVGGTLALVAFRYTRRRYETYRVG